MTRKFKIIVAAAAFGVIGLLTASQVLSEEKAPAGKDDPQAMMEQWLAMNAPGKEHKKFEEMVGLWTTQTKQWMAPGADPMVSMGTAEFRLILGGRYLEQIYKCDSMMGFKFEGHAIEGYDTVKKKFVSIWMDSMSTGIYLSEGTPNKEGKVITYTGKMDDPMTGEKDKVYKSVIRHIDKDTCFFEWYEPMPDGSQHLGMQIKYMRAKKK